jgi:hypothetical protein
MREREMSCEDPQNHEPSKQQQQAVGLHSNNKFASPATKKATVAQRIGITTGGGGGRGHQQSQLR